MMFNSILRTIIISLLCAVQLASIQSAMAFSTDGLCGSTGPSAEEGAKIHSMIQAHSRVQNQTRAAAPIRVFFHIILENQNGYGNIPDTVLAQQVSVLNRDFSGTGVSFVFSGVDRYVNYQWFHAAYYGTQARYDMYRTLRKGGAADLNLFTTALDQPPPGSDILLGYATFPWDYAANPAVDGVVLNWQTLPGGSSVGTNTGKIGTHEVGHWVGLLHTFEGGCSSPGDYVDDTPFEASPARGCPQGRDTCAGGGLDPINNHMDYTDDNCRFQFTVGQSGSILPVSAFGTDGLCGSTNTASAEESANIRNLVQNYTHSTAHARNQTRPARPIDVYFHVILENQNGDGDVSDNVIQQQVDVLNRHFSGTDVSFNLAGVDRHVNTLWYHSAYDTTNARVDMYRTLRIGGVADLNIFLTALDIPPAGARRLYGYATFPWDYQTRPVNLDGIVLDRQTLPGGNLADINTGGVGTHEVGHWVGLLHTFENGCNSSGDEVDDTPDEASEARGFPNCPKAFERQYRELMTLPDPIDNHMDYTVDSCRTEFTPGQIQRLQAILSYYRGVIF
ncbi:hypothetical protein CVT24_009633 [Panaeolus cyanescens]|uniref:Peptidase M43 pregnancy-associated plasma-A domain-containing protein n=1 Tax=Panaeolus cyanescens TaxID=181874 RepID=A0A409YA14_9AGAR|nr:hypothetical protein CVT24_009633 [Panaeolus cyanescens]